MFFLLMVTDEMEILTVTSVVGHYQILFSCAPGISEKKATGMVI